MKRESFIDNTVEGFIMIFDELEITRVPGDFDRPGIDFSHDFLVKYWMENYEEV